MDRRCVVERKTEETRIRAEFNLNGSGKNEITTGIGFFDHMLSLFCAHGFFDLSLHAKGDLDVDWHHTVEDVGIVLGDALSKSLKDRTGIVRYGHAVTPMDETLTAVSVDLSNRPFIVYNTPPATAGSHPFDMLLAKEFFRAFSSHGGMNLHINVFYGENAHHIIESIFKACGRAVDQAVGIDPRLEDRVRSTKNML